jgi:hypothetical protein
MYLRVIALCAFGGPGPFRLFYGVLPPVELFCRPSEFLRGRKAIFFGELVVGRRHWR